MYFDQLLHAARKVHAVCFVLLGAAHYTHFISNHDISLNMHNKLRPSGSFI